MHKRELELEKPKPGLVAVDGRCFPLEGAAIRASAQGGVAQSTLRQAYRNPYDEPLEVTYTLPLPADGAVIGFDIQVGDRRIVGEVESHDKALRKYREALETGRMAGILEQDRADTFTQNLGNVPPKTAVEVEIRVLHPVVFHGRSGDNPNSWEYRFPTVAGVRYEGEPGRVKDRDRIDVDRTNSDGTPVRLTLDLAIGDGSPADLAPQSASHEICVEAGEGAAVTLVHLKAPSRLDRDISVRWGATAPDVGLRFVEGSGLKGDKGRYGLLTIVPPDQPEHTLARDLTLLIDASGSMDGPSIMAARQVSARLLDSLGPRDRFQILAFATDVMRLVREPVDATEENIARAHKMLAALRAGGATEMSHAVEEALQSLRPESQRQVVLFTDGYIGFEQEVVKCILDHLPPGARLHVVGIGSAPNRTLTRGASRAGHGVEVLIAGPDFIDEAAAHLLAATVAPVLTDILIDGSAVIALAPERPRDVLAGQPLVVALQLSLGGGEIRVSGMVQGSTQGWTRSVQVSAAGKRDNAGSKMSAPDESPTSLHRTNLPIGALFGREAIEDEEMKLAATMGENKEILKRIESLGLRHRIASRCTSLVAVVDEPVVDPGKPRRRLRLPVEMPAGLNPEAVGYPTAGRVVQAMARHEGISRSSLQGMSERLPQPTQDQLPATGKSLDLPEISARCVRTDGDLLIAEFEAPRESFELMQDGSQLIVINEDGVGTLVSIDGNLSTGAGPHAPGLTLRLALRRIDGLSWKPGRILLVSTGSEMPLIVIDVT